MEIIKIQRTITEEDVKKFNEALPSVIELRSLKGQKSSILAMLNPKIKIRIIDQELDEKGEKEIIKGSLSKEKVAEYSPEELSSIVKVYEEIEEGIDVGFDNIDAALYTYISLIKMISPANAQKLDGKNEIELRETLISLLKSDALPKGFAVIYKQAMERLGIPCRIYENPNGYAWNEIMIDGAFYPLDLASDAEFYRSEKSENQIGICKFLTDKEFYFDPIHDTTELSDKEKKEIRAIAEKRVLASFEKIMSAEYNRKKESKPVIEVKSKQFAEIFKGGQITPETVSEVKALKISVTEAEVAELSADLAEIGRYYPEVLNTVELSNDSDKTVDMQELVDTIYESRQEAIDAGEEVEPIEVIISSSNEQDFNLDFSKVPKITTLNSTPVDGERQTKVVLRNTSTNPIKIATLNGRLSENIDVLDLTDFDLEGLDLTDSGVKRLALRGNGTVNADGLKGLISLLGVSAEAITMTEFNSIYPNLVSSTSNIHDISISGINLHDRKILEELSNNPNLARIAINRCFLNDIDGLENFDGRIATLNLANNDLDENDLGRICRFIETNPHLDIDLRENTGIESAFLAAGEMSDRSYDFIRDYFGLARGIDLYSKTDALNMLLTWFYNVPYYISDAELMREKLQFTRGPIMLESDDDLDNVDFTASYLQGATLLLTIPQVERLISSGKTIPQNVRLDIHDVTELTADRARELTQLMADNGMNLTGVQIFDKEGTNDGTNIVPYSMSQYVYIRETLDKVVAGIDMSEPDIDKFATIYDRLGSKITYDYGAIKHDSFAEAMYYSEKIFSTRSLLDGLTDEKCVCAGYADILRNALLLVGVDARYNCGICDSADLGSGHAWNQVLLDDGTGTGNKKWYYTDLTWDAGNDRYSWTLLGDVNFKTSGNHDVTYSRNAEVCTPDDYDRTLLREAFARARVRNAGYDYMHANIIDIPDDPTMAVTIPDQARIANEYNRRKNDMFAKFYGDKEYQTEYNERNARFREHEVERVDASGIVFRTIEDYPERAEDEEFLLLDKYAESLERITRYEAGDTSVYTGTPDQINRALEKDREYVETRNNTFDQHRHTQRDLATLGKYGERVPYIPRQTGVVRNIVRVVGNVGIFARNLVAPVYRGIGRFVAQPIHRLVTRGRDASPYRNNFYHRMVARRDYFEEMNNRDYPGENIRNFIRTRVQAITRAEEGNEAVLRAGAADIRQNIMNQEYNRALVQNMEARAAAFDAQIQALNDALTLDPLAANAADVRAAIARKTAERNNVASLADMYRNNIEGTIQTDAVSEKQHAVASKEVNTMKVTVIKGVVKGAATKLIGPKIHDWLLERGKITEEIEVPTRVPETKERWVDPTYKEEVVPVFDEVLASDQTMSDIIASNDGKTVTGFYSVWGAEKGATDFTISGNDKITAVFRSNGRGGTGLSDKVGLTAPRLTDRTFSSDLLNSNGLLDQNITLDQLLQGVHTGTLDPEAMSDLYVSVGDKCWVRLSDLVGDVSKTVQVGEEIKQVVDVPGHFEEYTEWVEKMVKTTRVVQNPAVEKAVNVGSKVVKGGLYADGIVDVVENVRTTDSNVRSNKRNPRNYTFDVDLDDIPTSKRDYDAR